jgi:myo-inositol catabolism protein IolC
MNDSLCILAFDHRKVLRDLFPGKDEKKYSELKLLVLDALSEVAGQVPGRFGYLVDEEYGAEAAIETKKRGLLLSMPVEASRTPEMILQYGDDFPAHIDKFKPDLVKTLIFHSSSDDSGRKERQITLLKKIQEWCQVNNYDYLVEIIINQSEESTRSRISKEGLFPELKSTITELSDAGVNPAVWKIEGLDSEDHTKQIGELKIFEQLNSQLIVLGSGASLEAVQNWVGNAAKAPNYSGFAVGRSVWQAPIGKYLEGNVNASQLITEVAGNFKMLVTAYEENL